MSAGSLKHTLTSLKNLFSKNARIFYSQFGEDIIADFFFKRNNKRTIHYLDIGSNDPIKGNNTYRFYLSGSRGILVEPNPLLAAKSRAARAGDQVVNAGVLDRPAAAMKFFLYEERYNALSTFSPEEVAMLDRERGLKPVQEIDIAVTTINDLIVQLGRCPDFVSIDVEGNDFEIISALDFDRYRPDLICLETMEPSFVEAPKRKENIFSLMERKGYKIYASTYYNTLFCPDELLNLTSHEI